MWGAALFACLGMMPLGVVWWARGQPRRAAGWGAAFGLATAGILGYGLLPAVAQGNTARGLARRIEAEGRPRTIYLMHAAALDVPSLLFYCRQSVTPLRQDRAPHLEPGETLVVRGSVGPDWRRAGLRWAGSEGKLSLWLPQPRDRPSSAAEAGQGR